MLDFICLEEETYWDVPAKLHVMKFIQDCVRALEYAATLLIEVCIIRSS